MKNFRLFFIFFFFSLLGFSQISKIHYIPPLTANDRQQGGAGSIPYGQYLYLSTPSTQPVSGTITILSTGTQIAFSTLSSTPLSNNNPITYEIVPQSATNPAAAMNNKLFVDPDETANSTGIQVLKAGLLVEADCPVYVSVRYYASAQSGAFTTKGVAALGTEFRTGMMTNGSQSVENTSQNGSNSHNLNFFSVMATENNTIVEIELPNAASILLGGTTNSYSYSGGSKIQKTLQQYESIILAQDFRNSQNNGSDRFGLIGALVKSVDLLGNKDSSKPVVVNTGSASGTFAASSGGHDHGVDQIVGIDRVGHEYIFVRGDGQDGAYQGVPYELENPLVVAAQDGTEIYREDTTPEELLAIFEQKKPDGWMKIWRDFELKMDEEQPAKYLVWPHSETDGWGEPIERDLPNYAICKQEFAYIMENELVDSDKQLEALECFSGIDDKVQELKLTLQIIHNRLKQLIKEIPKSTGGKWSKKYKKSINCKKPKGFSQKQHCRHGRKTRRKKN